MKPIVFVLIITLLTSCAGTYPVQHQPPGYSGEQQTLTHSLFNDKSATISEENIKKILEGNYRLPDKMKAAIVKLNPSNSRRYSRYTTSETDLKMQQSYIDLLTTELKNTNRVDEVLLMPELLVSENPTFTILREAAVRMQADIVVVYAVAGDVYYKYKVFSKDDIKAFATTQLMVMDVRTGLIPFSTVVTRDTLSHKKADETDIDETQRRVENAAALLTITEVGSQLEAFFKRK